MTKQEKNLSQKNNVNAKILLDLGRSYVEAVDRFLNSNNASNITDRIVGLACLRGTDIYMSAIRHNMTDHTIKSKCYRGTAILLREYADEVYEKQKFGIFFLKSAGFCNNIIALSERILYNTIGLSKEIQRGKD